MRSLFLHLTGVAGIFLVAVGLWFTVEWWSLVVTGVLLLILNAIGTYYAKFAHNAAKARASKP